MNLADIDEVDGCNDMDIESPDTVTAVWELDESPTILLTKNNDVMV